MLVLLMYNHLRRYHERKLLLIYAMADTERLGVVIPKDLKERLKRTAEVQERTLSQMAVILIREGLDRLEGKEDS